MAHALIRVHCNSLPMHWHHVCGWAAEGEDIQTISLRQLVCERGLIRNHDDPGGKVAT